jgi:hypothetical protein
MVTQGACPIVAFQTGDILAPSSLPGVRKDLVEIQIVSQPMTSGPLRAPRSEDDEPDEARGSNR